MRLTIPFVALALDCAISTAAAVAQEGINKMPPPVVDEGATTTSCDEVQERFEQEMAKVDLYRPALKPSFDVMQYPFWRQSGIIDCEGRRFDTLQVCIESVDMHSTTPDYVVRETKAKFTEVFSAFLQATRPGAKERLMPLIDEALAGVEQVIEVGEFGDSGFQRNVEAGFGQGYRMLVWVNVESGSIQMCVWNPRLSI